MDEHDSIILKGELFPRNETITLAAFVRFIPYWSNQKEVLRDFHMKRSDKLITAYENKSKERAKSGLPRPRSNIEQRSISKQASTNRFTRDGNMKTTTLLKNNSSKYLKRYKEK